MPTIQQILTLILCPFSFYQAQMHLDFKTIIFKVNKLCNLISRMRFSGCKHSNAWVCADTVKSVFV